MTLCIQHLAFERNDTLLFREINCELHAGEMLQIRGANGCGKSTLLRILAGFIRPEIGTILWQGKNIFQILDDYTQQLAYLGHQNGIKPYLTVYENLELNCALSGIKIQPELLKTVLRTMKLLHAQDTQAINLSAGQKRRLALSRLQLARKARLWILDEPTTALDSSGQNLLADILKRHLTQGGMAIVATHHELGVESRTLHLSGEAAYV